MHLRKMKWVLSPAIYTEWCWTVFVIRGTTAVLHWYYYTLSSTRNISKALSAQQGQPMKTSSDKQKYCPKWWPRRRSREYWLKRECLLTSQLQWPSETWLLVYCSIEMRGWNMRSCWLPIAVAIWNLTVCFVLNPSASRIHECLLDAQWRDWVQVSMRAKHR